MARIKFSLFVVICVALAIGWLGSVSRSVASLSRTQATERLNWAKALFQASDRLAQTYRTHALTQAAADAELLAAAAGLSDAVPAQPALEAAKKAVAAAFEKLPEALRGPTFVVLGGIKGVGALPASGDAVVKDDPTLFALSSASSGPQGGWALVDGKLYQVAAVPLTPPGAEQPVGTLGVAYLVDNRFAKLQKDDLTVDVTILAKGVAGSTLADPVRMSVAASPEGPIAGAPAGSLGPVSLPILAGDDGASLYSAAVPLAGMPGAKVLLSTESPGLPKLVELQQRAILFLLGLVLLAAAFILVLGSAQTAQAAVPARAEPKAEARASSAARPAAPAKAPVQAPAPAHAPVPMPIAAPEPPPAAEPNFDDFPFGNTPAASPVAGPPMQTAPMPEPARPAPAPAPRPTPPSMVAVPMPPPAPTAQQTPFDPFAAVAQQEPAAPYNPEATVVATVSADLLRQSSQVANAAAAAPPAQNHFSSAVAIPLPPPPSAMPPPPAAPPPAAAADGEDAHFQEVFLQFLTTRTQCNEPADGLTFEKFVVKLRKNKEQLVQKYNCKSVRFQVYVKEGKAALKATPVKE